MADGKKGEDRFEDVCAELGNSAMAVYGTACYLASGMCLDAQVERRLPGGR